MNEKEIKNEYVTEKYLDKKLGENNQLLLNAIDSILTKRLTEGLTEVKEDLRIDINNNQTIIDGYVKNQEDFKQEFLIMKEEVKQIKKALKEKLGLEINAVI